MSKTDHIHRYRKVNLARKKGAEPYFVYQCTKPTCSHYVPVHMALGKMCECNRCHEIMVIGKTQLYRGTAGQAMKLPHCDDCVRKKEKISNDDVAAVTDFLAQKEKNIS